MNWLIYIPGWIIGAVFVLIVFLFFWRINEIGGEEDFKKKDQHTLAILFLVALAMWTSMWIWFCWRFIA